MAIGKLGGKGNHNCGLQYIGISSVNICKRLAPPHEKLDLLNQEMKIWLGQIATAEPAGKRAHVTFTTLRYAEWMHVYFLKLPLNERKKDYLPPRPVTVLNRWWKTDFNTPWLNHPHKDWPRFNRFRRFRISCSNRVVRSTERGNFSAARF